MITLEPEAAYSGSFICYRKLPRGSVQNMLSCQAIKTRDLDTAVTHLRTVKQNLQKAKSQKNQTRT